MQKLAVIQPIEQFTTFVWLMRELVDRPIYITHKNPLGQSFHLFVE